MRTKALIAAAVLAAVAMPASAQTRASIPPVLTYTQPLPPPTIQLVQQQLRQQGAYTGRIDGLWGADSQTALERFQATHGLQVTGQLNQATAATLGLSLEQVLASATPPTAPALAAAPVGLAPPLVPLAPEATPSRAAILAIQTRLHDLNFYNGAPDGVWGGETQLAIQRFQQGRGLQANGQLNPATLQALGLASTLVVAPR